MCYTANMQKGFAGILILIVVLVVAVGAGAYYWGTQKSGGIMPSSQTSAPSASTIPTPDETANWKTYTNTKYKFSIKAPSELEVEQEENGFYITNASRAQKEIADQYIPGRITVDVYDSSQFEVYETISELVKLSQGNKSSGGAFGPYLFTKTAEQNVNGAKWMIYDAIPDPNYDGGEPFPYRKVAILSRGSVYYLFSTEVNNKEDEYIKYFDQILTAFNFN